MKASDGHDAAALRAPLCWVVHLMAQGQKLEEMVQVQATMVSSLGAILCSSLIQAL